ncbi:cuticle protein 16.8-like [Tropilaelaps mercedesae]|uniref:Cuticle protein 16.8-like n=1 Tax=Tropilaelaps mercedesae TaxID=418985 RepID=A0A1V9Y3B2_9ACAR|nr:cuticle protein 16.8-like [Tropilaelaps mercedesae]
MIKIALLGSLACFAALLEAIPRGRLYSRRVGPQNLYYRPAPFQSHSPPRALAYAATDPVSTENSFYPPQPYQFGYDTIDEYGTKMTRHEESDANNRKKGSYSFTDAHGITRRVDYVADEHGFRATINTNEPGTAPSQPASAIINAPPLPPALKASASNRSPIIYTRNRPLYQTAPSYNVTYGRHRSYRHY